MALDWPTGLLRLLGLQAELEKARIQCWSLHSEQGYFYFLLTFKSLVRGVNCETIKE